MLRHAVVMNGEHKGEPFFFLKGSEQLAATSGRVQMNLVLRNTGRVLFIMIGEEDY